MHVMSTPPLWVDAMAVYPFAPGVEAAFTFQSKYGDIVCMAVKRGNHILVPRRCAPLGDKDFRTTSPITAIDCSDILYEEQQDIAKKSVDLLKSGVDHVIEAPTGWGKSVCGAAIGAMMGERTLIMVQKQDLMDSWRDAIVNVLGFKSDEVGIAQGNQLSYKGKRFVLGMVQSLMVEDKFDEDFWSAFGLGIFDEVDTMAADMFVKPCQRLKARYRLGMTATPERPDGKTPVIKAHIGPVMLKGLVVPMKPKILVQETGWEIPQWARKNLDPGKMMHVFKAMANNEPRNMIITQFVKSCYAKDRHVLVLGETVDHLKHLMSMAIQAGVPPEDTGLYIGEFAKNKTLLKMNAMKRCVFATYGMCSRGTNYPHWDSLVYATPRSNIKQPLGRILRFKEGKKEPVCLDLVDKSDILRKFHQKRLTQYYQVHASIVKIASH